MLPIDTKVRFLYAEQPKRGRIVGPGDRAGWVRVAWPLRGRNALSRSVELPEAVLEVLK